MMVGGDLETYTYHPPQMRPTQMPYHVLVAGSRGCPHELLDQDWRDRIAVRDGIVFIAFTCKICGRQICQSLEEVLPPSTWKRGDADQPSLFVQEATNPLAPIWMQS
jgi:hypothetical protein